MKTQSWSANLMYRCGFSLALLLFGVLFSNADDGSSLVSPKQPIPPTFFGMHIGLAASSTPWPDVPVPAWRLWDSQVKWPDLEPSKGQWRFETLDKYVAIAEQHHTEILLPLAMTPRWASSLPDVKSGWQAPGLTAAPADMNDWRTYVRQVVTRYKGHIHAYEIWNEPNLKQFWIGSTEQLVAMTKDAHDIIMSIDPGAILVSPSATTGRGIPWLADFLSKGGGRDVDIIGYHFYAFPHPPEAMLQLVERVKQTMKDNGVEDKPVWDTELGWAEPKPFPSEDLAAAYLARSFILNWAFGIQRVYWYGWDNHTFSSIETTATDNKTLRPAGRAYGTIQKWLVGAYMQSCNESAGQTWTCEMHHGNKSQWILWTSDKSGAIFPLPSSWHAESFTSLLGEHGPLKGTGVPISQVPVLVESAASSSPTSALTSSPITSETLRYTRTGGAYPIGQEIPLSSGISDAVIHYTGDGGQTSVNSTVYQTPMVLTKRQIVRTIAVAGRAISSQASATSTIKTAVVRPQAPRYTPSGGAYPIGQQIALSSGTSGAVIHYTVDGSQASVNSTVYRGPLTLKKGQIVRAIAVAGHAISSEASATFTIKPAVVRPQAPRYTPSGGAYPIGQQIALSSGTSGAVVHYTVDGSQASVNSTVYRGPLTLKNGQIVRAIAVAGHAISSEASATFTIKTAVVRPQAPRYTPSGGAYPIGQQIALSSGTSGAVIHYTVDGSQASVNSPVYRTPLILAGPQIIRAIAVVRNVSSSEGSVVFEVTPISIPPSLFGMTVLDFTKLAPPIPFGTTRTWDAYPNLDWSDANPSIGTYNFAYLDKFIATNQARGSDIIYTLGRTPRWASSQPNAPGVYGPGQCAPPTDMNYYENYVRAIATHAAGRIKYWELWNEPQSVYFYCGDIRTMVTMAKIAHQVIKGIDSDALILSPGVTGGLGPAWLSSFLSEGGAQYVDVIAFHGYWSASAEDLVDVISNYRTVMAANGVAGKPLWDTESSWGGFGNLGTPSISHQVGYIAKSYLLHWSHGVSRFLWYAYDGGPIWGGLWNSKTGESAAAKSYGEIYRWMVGATLESPCSKNQEGIWTCALSRPGGYMAEAVWISNTGASFTVPPHYTEYLDLSGATHMITGPTITVGDEPILLENRTLP